MAKSSKDRDRRAVVEEMRRKQRSQERRRTFGVVGICLVLGAVIIGFAAKELVDQRNKEGRDLSDIGVSRAAASCQPIETKPYDGPANNHVASGVKVDYADAPPAMGQHDGNFLRGDEIKNRYSVEDRPPVERLVHSLEHGYSILWYDETIGKDTAAVDDLASIAAKYPIGDKLIIAPWTADDGKAFPDDAHLALTHWTGPKNQKGVWEYCGRVSGTVVQEFTEKYGPNNAPEPNAV